MDLLDTKSVVRIWSDTDEPSTVPSSKPQQPSSGSSLRSTNDHHRFRPYSPSSRKLGPSRSVVRQASDNELLYSSSRRGLSAKNLLVDRVNQQLPPRFGANVAKPVKLRRYRTEPVILALKAELKKETGITPNTPERNENPFEPNDLPGKMARPWLDVDPAMFDIPPKSPDSFKWSIDHMSTLHPVEILRTDVLRTEFLKHVQTESDEENAQANIVRFFDEDSFHPPTPTSDSANPAALNTIERDSPEEGKHEPIVNKSYVIPRSGAETKDVSCQTDIHISPRFNFDKYFADYQTQVRLKAFRESAGSVRRRLFTDIEEEMEPWERSLSAVPSFSQKMNESLGFDFEPVELCSGLDDSSTQDENAPCSSIY